MMLSDMRERGSSDEELRELVTPENYERYKKISYGMCAAQVKGDFAIRHIMQQQSLVVDRARVDEEVMTLQAQAMQRGEKFKESETRPKVEAQLQKDMVLDWLEERSEVSVVDEKEFDATEALGATPEELAARVAETEQGEA